MRTSEIVEDRVGSLDPTCLWYDQILNRMSVSGLQVEGNDHTEIRPAIDNML